jgi:hypothetical protein
MDHVLWRTERDDRVCNPFLLSYLQEVHFQNLNKQERETKRKRERRRCKSMLQDQAQVVPWRRPECAPYAPYWPISTGAREAKGQPTACGRLEKRTHSTTSTG